MKYRFADCVLDLAQRRLSRAGDPIAVEPQVFDLLTLLARAPDRVVTKDEIVEAVWGGRIVSDSAISARIAAARRAVGDDGARQSVIRTVARRGLQMVAEVAEEGLAEPPVPAADVQRIRYARLPSGHAMAYAETGVGPPVILVGQGHTDLEIEWGLPFERQRFMALSARNRLIRFDPLGSGQSDRTLDRIAVEDQAEDIVGLADALGLERFALLSQSGGCSAALHVAAHYPERVTRLALVGGYADGRTVRDGATPAEAEPLRAMISEGWTRNESSFLHAFLFSYQPEGPIEAVKGYANMMQRACTQDYILKRRDTSNLHSSAALLPRIACPTLILHGRGDGVHPLSEARKLASGIAEAELVVLETANHIPWPGNAAYETYMATVSGFLAEAPQ